MRASVRATLDLDKGGLGLVVDLKRGVLDPEALIEDSLELSPDCVTVVAGTHEHVG